MTVATESIPTRHARRAAHAPRPLPGWLQVGVVLLLLWNGLQMITHRNEPSLAANTDQTAPSSPQARFAYTYQPDDLRATGNMQPAFQYAGYYAHASSAMIVTPVHAYDPSDGRWLSRDPLGEGSDSTLYSYVWNNPSNLVDPFGLAGGAGSGWVPPRNASPTDAQKTEGGIVAGGMITILAAPVAAEVVTSQGVRIVTATVIMRCSRLLPKDPPTEPPPTEAPSFPKPPSPDRGQPGPLPPSHGGGGRGGPGGPYDPGDWWKWN
jgi:RHS repeat-associated protein